MLTELIMIVGFLATNHTTECSKAKTFVIHAECKCTLNLDNEAVEPKLDIMKQPTIRITCYANLKDALKDLPVICQDTAVIIDNNKLYQPDCQSPSESLEDR